MRRTTAIPGRTLLVWPGSPQTKAVPWPRRGAPAHEAAPNTTAPNVASPTTVRQRRWGRGWSGEPGTHSQAPSSAPTSTATVVITAIGGTAHPWTTTATAHHAAGTKPWASAIRRRRLPQRPARLRPQVTGQARDCQLNHTGTENRGDRKEDANRDPPEASHSCRRPVCDPQGRCPAQAENGAGRSELEDTHLREPRGRHRYQRRQQGCHCQHRERRCQPVEEQRRPRVRKGDARLVHQPPGVEAQRHREADPATASDHGPEPLGDRQ